jgi:2-C-methyl-D-erythritol 4-phosphate cytidylyltransferase
MTETSAMTGRIAVVIPAGGVGARFGGRIPKQFLRLQRVPVLTVTVGHFARHPAVMAIVVAAPEAHVARARRVLAPIARRKSLLVVPGGRTRQDSVWLAMQAVPDEAELIVVHDAVRPLITRGLIDAVARAAAESGAAICALPIAETVKRVREDIVEATLDRSELRAVQTPQAFHADLLREAHEKAQRDAVVGTDDAMLVERLGHPVRVVRGLAQNVKITTPDDLRRARRAGAR